MEERNLCWLAGLLEGEGCFALRRHSNRPRAIGSPSIQLQMTDRDVVERAAFLLDRPVHQRVKADGRKTVYIVELCGRAAIPMMEMLLPYMGKRRADKIREIIAADKSRPGVPSGELQGRAKLTNAQADEIRTVYAKDPKTWTQNVLAEKYGVKQSTIWSVVNCKTYVAHATLTRK